MASPLHAIAPPITHLQTALRNQGSNNSKRGAAVGIASQTVQKILDGRSSAMLNWLATQPEMCAALLADAVRNAPARDWPAYNAIEQQLAEVGRLLEDQADEIHGEALEAAAQIADPV